MPYAFEANQYKGIERCDKGKQYGGKGLRQDGVLMTRDERRLEL